MANRELFQVRGNHDVDGALYETGIHTQLHVAYDRFKLFAENPEKISSTKSK